MVLIGDPKQAIYAFRGGDIVTYLRAAETAGTTQTLGVNYRADEALLGRLQALLGSAAARGRADRGAPGRGAPTRGRRLAGGRVSPFRRPGGRARRVRGRDQRAKVTVGRWRDHVTLDVAREIKRLLLSRPTFDGRDRRARGRRRAGRAPGRAAQAVQEALAELGVPAVISSGGTVFHTPGRDRVADPARGDRAAAPHRPGAGGGAHVVLRCLGRRSRPRRGRGAPTGSPTGCAPWPTSSPPGAWPPSSRPPWSTASPPGCSPGSGASAR